LVRTFAYTSGEDVREGDHIRYHGEIGSVEFVAAEKVGNPSLDWFVEEFPGGGVMINAKSFGAVFLSPDDIDERLEFVARRV
jgi:hypothetical protein